jgi:hypothetical protein
MANKKIWRRGFRAVFGFGAVLSATYSVLALWALGLYCTLRHATYADPLPLWAFSLMSTSNLKSMAVQEDIGIGHCGYDPGWSLLIRINH